MIPAHWMIDYIYDNEVDGQTAEKLRSYQTVDLTFQIREICLYNIPIQYSVVE